MFGNLQLPDGSSLSYTSIRAAISLPKLLLGLEDPILSLSAGRRCPTAFISKCDNFPAFCKAYSHEELRRVRDHLSYAPDVVTSEILGLRDTNWRSPVGRLYGVPREPTLSSLCNMLLGFFARYDPIPCVEETENDPPSCSPDPLIQSRTLRWVVLVLQLDRYCRKAMVNAVKGILLRNEIPSAFLDRATSLSKESRVGDLRSLVEDLPARWLHRHRLPGGRIHIQTVSWGKNRLYLLVI